MPGQYVLLTAAKNEEAYIGEAIESVLKQSELPLAWFIMDDGSTDHTGEIVRRFATKHAFLHLHEMPTGEGRNFGAQYRAIQAGFDIARPLDFEFVGVQDADIAIERADYYERILQKFRHNPRLGLAGGYIYERRDGTWQCRKGNSPDSVAGGIQLFRRACFEQIGRYTPLRLGGSDWLAQIDALMGGWEVAACTDLPVRHYRPTSSAEGRLRGWYREGQLAASFGSHPVFEALKCARRCVFPPLVLGGLTRLSGYFSWKCRNKPLLPPEKVTFLRRHQMAKLARRLSAAGGSGSETAAAPAAPPIKTS